MERPPHDTDDWMQQALEALPSTESSTFHVRNPDSLLHNPEKSPPPPAERFPGWQRWAAYSALALGVFNLCSWVIPLFGIPLALAGIGLSIPGLKFEPRRISVVAIILSAIGLFCGILNATIGVFSVQAF